MGNLGPVSGGDNSKDVKLGKEYCDEQQAKQKEEGPTPWKAPTGESYVPIVNNELTPELQALAKKDIKKLPKDKIPKKLMFDHIDVATNVRELPPNAGRLIKLADTFANSLPDDAKKEYDAASDKRAFLAKYLVEHPEFKPNLAEVREVPDDSVRVKNNDNKPFPTK